MLLNMTPSGNEIQRKLLLSHASKTKTIFVLTLVASVLIALFVGSYYAKTPQSVDSSFIRNIAKIEVPGVGTGTAFLLTSSEGTHHGILMTAGHVVSGAHDKTVNLIFEQVKGEDGEPLVTTGSIIWQSDVPSYDPYTIEKMRMDVALVKLDDMSVLPEDVVGFTIKPEPEMQEEIVIYGFPKGDEYSSTGIVSSLKFQDCEDLITMDIQLVGGLSGAPVFNKENGEVIAMAVGSRHDELNYGITASGEQVVVAAQNDLFNSAIKMRRVIEVLDAAGMLNLIQ